MKVIDALLYASNIGQDNAHDAFVGLPAVRIPSGLSRNCN